MPEQRLLISGAHVFCSADVWRPGWVLTEGHRIKLVGAGQPPAFLADAVTRHVDATGLSLLPGFIDLHVHGAVGHEVMDASADGLRAMARFYASHGVTGFLPSSLTASREQTDRALAVVAELTGPVEGGATILGAHLEGPYFNVARCGAQDPRHIRRAEKDEAFAWLDTGIVRLLAVAPEYDENLWLIDECVRRGVTVSAAHTSATYEQMLTAVAHGLTQATHSYNAMTGLHHRDPGTVGAIMTLPQIRCELIADTIHVHPAPMRILLDVKGPARVILVTDARRPAGLAEGDYPIDDRTVTVRDGAVRFADGTLAGSVLTMDRALHNIVSAADRPLSELWPLSSLNAARAIGLTATKGSIEVGKDADLTLLDADYQVRMTIAEGRIVYEAMS